MNIANIDYLTSLLEPDFVNPVFRMMFNQNPYNVNVITLTTAADSSNRKFVKVLKNVSEPTVVVLKDEKGDLVDTVFVPIPKPDDNIDSSLPFNQTIANLLAPVFSEAI